MSTEFVNSLKDKFFSIRQTDELVCFDFFNSYPFLDKNKIIYDVKTLYDLAGYETDDLVPLAEKVLGRSRIANYILLSKKMNAYLKSYKDSKIDYSKFSIERLLPKDLYEKICSERSAILYELYQKSEEKEFYKTFFSVLKCLFEISSSPLYIDLNSIKEDNSRFSSLIRLLAKNDQLFLHFSAVGAKTGRLSFKKGTVSIYHLPKELRKCIVAPKDYQIVQFDFKSFQPRLAIFCTDDKDFRNKFVDVEDIYSVFPGEREKNKIEFLSWMFAKKRKHPIFDDVAGAILFFRKKLLSVKHNDKLVNKFGRTLHCGNEEENIVFQNYITSNEVDAILTLMVSIHQSLKDRKSRILLPFHDCIIFYIHDSEMALIKEIKNIMETKHKDLFGSSFPVTVKIGQNFGNMKTFKELS